jgi:predicted Zn finger-like uncharacterized protein
MSPSNETVCPHCGAQLAVRFDQVGWSVTCMKCEKSFDLAEAVHAPAAEDRSRPAPRTRSAKRSDFAYS